MESTLILNVMEVENIQNTEYTGYSCNEKAGQEATVNLKSVGSCQTIYHYSAYLKPVLLYGMLFYKEPTHKGRVLRCQMEV